MSGSTISVHRPCLGRKELDELQGVLASGWLGHGPKTREFEERVRALIGARHFLAVSTGTAAIHLALEAIEIEPGAEVIVPSLTFAASIQPIVSVGARPVFCEVCPKTLTLDVEDVLDRVTARTRAVLPVHYAGIVCDTPALRRRLGGDRIRIIEDAAQAFGSSSGGRPVGCQADLTCFSFDPIKNITCGAGGGIATESTAFAERIRLRRNLGIDLSTWDRQSAGRPRSYSVVDGGHRYLMSDLNAAIGLAQLEFVEAFRHRKREIVRRYTKAFSGIDGLRLLRRRLDEEFPFSFVVRVLDGRRDALADHLRERGIQSLVHYVPNHLQPAFAPYRDDLPVTERLFDELLTLPLHVELGEEDISRVIAAVDGFFAAAVTSRSTAPRRG